MSNQIKKVVVPKDMDEHFLNVLISSSCYPAAAISYEKKPFYKYTGPTAIFMAEPRSEREIKRILENNPQIVLIHSVDTQNSHLQEVDEAAISFTEFSLDDEGKLFKKSIGNWTSTK